MLRRQQKKTINSEIELLTYVYEGFMLHHKLKHNRLSIIFMCSINEHNQYVI